MKRIIGQFQLLLWKYSFVCWSDMVAFNYPLLLKMNIAAQKYDPAIFAFTNLFSTFMKNFKNLIRPTDQPTNQHTDHQVYSSQISCTSLNMTALKNLPQDTIKEQLREVEQVWRSNQYSKVSNNHVGWQRNKHVGGHNALRLIIVQEVIIMQVGIILKSQ